MERGPGKGIGLQGRPIRSDWIGAGFDDHRHADGTPDEITNYGGWANQEGTVWRQHFVADKETADLIPAAATNVWMLQYEPVSKVLTYDLKRHDLPRYQAQLKPQ